MKLPGWKSLFADDARLIGHWRAPHSLRQFFRSLPRLLPDPVDLRQFERASHYVPLVLGIAVIYLLNLSLALFDQARQLALGWGCFAILVVMFRLKWFKRPPWRFVVIVLSAFLALRYFIWRTTVTLVYTDFWDFVGMTALYLAETYSIVIHLLGMFVNLWPMRNRPALLPSEPESYPTVDVLIPTYDEAEEIVRITAVAATQLDYPREKLRVYICDDGGTLNKRNHPQSGEAAWERHYRLRHLAQELGINYLTRETNHSAKAGNINHALRRTSGDLILLLDCDHVPTRDFLSRTVEYFIADPQLFLVQTPHFFINPSPVEANLVGAGNPSSESDLFYREIHRSLDFWNASYFCGSAGILRRTHLLEVGGFDGSTITEDAETALKLHSAGYNSTYMDRPMVCGLAPDNYDSYVLQRTRWAQGMTQMLVMHNPLIASGLSFKQRLCYFNSCFFWLFGFARMTFYLAPAMFLLFGLRIYHVSMDQILAIAVPYVLSTFFVIDYFYGRTRQPLFSEIYESVQAIFLIPAIISVFLNPTRPAFKVTPKGQTQERESLNSRATIFVFIIMISVLSLGAAILRWIDFPAQRDTIVVTGVWCCYNLLLTLVSLGAFWERRQIRNAYRIKVQERIHVDFPRLNLETDCLSADISLYGIRFYASLPHRPRVKERVFITVPLADGESHTFDAQLQRIEIDGEEYVCGAKFLLDAESYPKAVAFVYGDSARWLKLWMQKAIAPGKVRMLARFFKLGLRGALVSTVLITRNIYSSLVVSLQTLRISWSARAGAGP